MPSCQRGSILLEVVVFLGILAVFSMTLMGQLAFMTKVSAQEDARVQGLMAARIQMEDMRTEWSYAVNYGTPLVGTFTPSGFDRLSEGGYRITRVESALYQVEIWVNNKTGEAAYETLSQVWVKP